MPLEGCKKISRSRQRLILVVELIASDKEPLLFLHGFVSLILIKQSLSRISRGREREREAEEAAGRQVVVLLVFFCLRPNTARSFAAVHAPHVLLVVSFVQPAISIFLFPFSWLFSFFVIQPFDHIMDQLSSVPRLQLPNVADIVNKPVIAAKTSCERYLFWNGRTKFILPALPSKHTDFLVSCSLCHLISCKLTLPLRLASVSMCGSLGASTSVD